MREVRGGAGAIPERRSMSLGWFAAAAAALVAVVIGAENVSLRDRAAQSVAEQRAQLIAERTQLDEQRTRLADLQGRQRALEARLIAVVAPGGRHYAIPQGEIVTNAGKLFVAVELAALPSGKVYQAWTIAKGATAIKPSVTFSPGPSGVAIVALPVDAAGIAAVAVSVEPAGGSKAPTTTPKFIRKLS